MFSTIVALTITLNGLAYAANYAFLDQACGASTTQSTCAFDYKQVPILMQPVHIDGTIGGCVSQQGVCQFDRSISCQNSGIATVIRDAVSQLAKCAATTNIDAITGCPTVCGQQINRVVAAHFIACHEQEFTTLAAAAKQLAQASDDVLRNAITQFLVCATDAVTPAELNALATFMRKLTANQVQTGVNELKMCFAVSDDDIRAAFNELIKMRNQVDTAISTNSQAQSPAGSTAPSTSGVGSRLETLISVAALLFVPTVMMLNFI
jgi:bacterioferritin-associated ferredoxin